VNDVVGGARFSWSRQACGTLISSQRNQCASLSWLYRMTVDRSSFCVDWNVVDMYVLLVDTVCCVFMLGNKSLMDTVRWISVVGEGMET
jgi:hypothetical protein